MFHATRTGLAKNIDEYVPVIIPIVSAKAKSFNAAVPNIRSRITGSSVVIEVFIDLVKVIFIESFTTLE